MVKNKLAERQVRERGWLLDGYPRSGEQAEAIEREGIRPDVFLLINVPDELLVDRVVGRRRCVCLWGGGARRRDWGGTLAPVPCMRSVWSERLINTCVLPCPA